MLFGYVGPETVLPVASVLAATMGVLLMFGRRVLGFFVGAFRAVFRRRGQERPETMASRSCEAPESRKDCISGS